MSEKYQGENYHRYPGYHRVFITFLAPTFVVTVSGNWFNPCGHMLLNTGGVGGSYFHISEVRGYPYCMNQTNYGRYCRENQKVELNREQVIVRNPDAAKRKLVDLLLDKWTWGVIPHNCVHFVEQVLQAGGTNFGLYSNCPTLGY